MNYKNAGCFQPAFVIKTPGCAGEFKKSFSVPYEEKTPFDTIRVRSANCTKVSKGGQKA